VHVNIGRCLHLHNNKQVVAAAHALHSLGGGAGAHRASEHHAATSGCSACCFREIVPVQFATKPYLKVNICNKSKNTVPLQALSYALAFNIVQGL
jgi:hypothetical protein